MLESKTEEITYLKILSRDKEFAIGKIYIGKNLQSQIKIK